ncbi:MAG TPA: cytochrome c [Longimicrobiaceae bacterium]
MRRRPVLLLLLTVVACEPSSGGERSGVDGMASAHAGAAETAIDTTGLALLPVPDQHQRGEAIYRANCSSCHGEAALGTPRGPPLIHRIYEPSHHADISFVLAAERGVRAHHWQFGDMPPQPGVTRDEVEEVVGYIRWLQREAGVY